MQRRVPEQSGIRPTRGLTGPRTLCAVRSSQLLEVRMNNLHPTENKFHKGNGSDGKHYWITPPEVMWPLQMEFAFDFDPCPCPLPEGFDGLTCEWGQSNYVNPPFGSIVHQGRKKGMTAWVRKALAEHAKGKRVVMVYPIDKWILMLLKAGAQVRNLGDVRWLATEDGSAGKGTGRHIACFVLNPSNVRGQRTRHLVAGTLDPLVGRILLVVCVLP